MHRTCTSLRSVVLITGLSILAVTGFETRAQPESIDRSNLVLELLFDGDARDTSGNGHHGEVFGAVLTTDRFGQADAAYAFDGLNDYIRVAPPPALSSEAFTLSVWVKYNEGAFSRWWSNGIVTQDSGGSGVRRVFQLSAFGPLPTWHLMGRGRDPLITRPVDTEQWRHLAVAFDGTVHRLYMDGVLYDESEAPFPPHPEEPLYVGRKGSGEPGFYVNGTIDDVRIYTAELSPEAIEGLARENGWTPPPLHDRVARPGRPVSTLNEALVGHWTMDTGEMRDASGHGLHAIVLGSPELVKGKKGNAIRFDGKRDWAVVKDESLDLLHYLTVTSWIRGFDPVRGYGQVVWYGDGAWGQDPYSLSIQEGRIGFRVDDIATQWEVKTETGPSPDEWTFVAGVLDTNDDGLMKLKLYVNGILAAEKTSEEPYRYIALGRMWLCFASVGDGDTLTELDLDEVRIYNRPLSPEEVSTLYHAEQE